MNNLLDSNLENYQRKKFKISFFRLLRLYTDYIRPTWCTFSSILPISWSIKKGKSRLSTMELHNFKIQLIPFSMQMNITSQYLQNFASPRSVTTFLWEHYSLSSFARDILRLQAGRSVINIWRGKELIKKMLRLIKIWSDSLLVLIWDNRNSQYRPCMR